MRMMGHISIQSSFFRLSDLWPHAMVKAPLTISLANYAPFNLALSINTLMPLRLFIFAGEYWLTEDIIFHRGVGLCWEGWFPKPCCNVMLWCYCHHIIACFQESLQWSQTSFSFAMGKDYFGNSTHFNFGFEGVIQTKQHLVLIQQFLRQFTVFSNIIFSQHAMNWLTTTTRTRYAFELIMRGSSHLVFCQRKECTLKNQTL